MSDNLNPSVPAARDLTFIPSSPWGAWVHPVKCFRSLVEARERITVIEEDREARNREIQSVMQRITDTQALLDEARGEIASLRGTLAERSAELANAEAQVRRLTSELDEMKEVERKLKEFEATLNKVEEMKRRYEQRIENLRSRLKEYNDMVGVNDELAIDMEGPARQGNRAPATAIAVNPKAPGASAPGVPPAAAIPEYPEPPETDWLQPLDDF